MKRYRPQNYQKWIDNLKRDEWWIMFETNTFQLNYIEYKKQYLRDKKLQDFIRFKQGNIAEDKDGHLVYLAQSEWFLNTEMQNNPAIEFHFTSEVHK